MGEVSITHSAAICAVTAWYALLLTKCIAHRQSKDAVQAQEHMHEPWGLPWIEGCGMDLLRADARLGLLLTSSLCRSVTCKLLFLHWRLGNRQATAQCHQYDLDAHRNCPVIRWLCWSDHELCCGRKRPCGICAWTEAPQSQFVVCVQV